MEYGSFDVYINNSPSCGLTRKTAKIDTQNCKKRPKMPILKHFGALLTYLSYFDYFLKSVNKTLQF